MIRFEYTARDQNGKLVTGMIEHLDQDEAVNALQASGFIVIAIGSQRKLGAKKPAVRKLRYGVRSEDLTLFCRQLTTLLNAGVTLLRSLNILLKQTDSRTLYYTIDSVRMDVEEGRSLRDAALKHPKIFTSFWINMIETGEASGQLAVAFERLAIYLEKTDAIRRKVKSALVYPAILILISVLAISVFVFRIIPMFNDIYKGFDTQLPVFILVVFTFSNFLRKNILLMLIFFAAIFFIIRRLINTKKGREIFDKMILKLPLLGSLLEFVIIERFANALGTLIKSGVPILSGLYIVGDSCGNKLYKDVIDTAAEEIKAGKAMCEPIEASGLFPPIVVQMIRVGEETGKMGEMLDRLAVYYQERITTKIDALMATFEPILLVCMGAIIGILVIAMYLPIFKIATVGTRQ